MTIAIIDILTYYYWYWSVYCYIVHRDEVLLLHYWWKVCSLFCIVIDDTVGILLFDWNYCCIVPLLFHLRCYWFVIVVVLESIETFVIVDLFVVAVTLYIDEVNFGEEVCMFCYLFYFMKADYVVICSIIWPWYLKRLIIDVVWRYYQLWYLIHIVNLLIIEMLPFDMILYCDMMVTIVDDTYCICWNYWWWYCYFWNLLLVLLLLPLEAYYMEVWCFLRWWYWAIVVDMQNVGEVFYILILYYSDYTLLMIGMRKTGILWYY